MRIAGLVVRRGHPLWFATLFPLALYSGSGLGWGFPPSTAAGCGRAPHLWQDLLLTPSPWIQREGWGGGSSSVAI